MTTFAARIKFSLGVLFTLLLFGCGGATVVSRVDSTPAPQKLTSATVVWVSNTSFPYDISKSSRYRPKIDESDKQYAKRVVGRLLVLFRKSAPNLMTEQFVKHGVAQGGAATLEITPTRGSVFIGGGRGFTARASIKETASGREIWSVTIKAFGPTWKDDEVLLNNFVVQLVSELKGAGWLI